ncbi:NAD-dependent epimerase/dehydratase family protein [bacterium SCSIO 12643]|nr:NAD-dependent epimerase/dehydratase family protein [bacterium SCSIO 12643]
MSVVIVTGSGGLIGSQSVNHFSKHFDTVVGIDNDMRSYFFGKEASTKHSSEFLQKEIENFVHVEADIRDEKAINKVFEAYGKDIELIIHTAAQPSHDWAAREPFTDFSVNANGTLVLLEAYRKYAEKATFVFTSTNKVYGDLPNSLPLVELDKRWEIDQNHQYFAQGIDEKFSIDQSKHSLFGASKVAADVLVQEYGRYFNLNTGIFRGGCLTGPNHAGTELHGFLSYLMKCAITGREYTIFGYKGKQVRDNIHSDDLIRMFHEFHKSPRVAEVYNVGGGRFSNCSMMEAIEMSEEITGNKFNYKYSEVNRIGDHIWYISDTSKFKAHYPGWEQKYDVKDILVQIFNFEKSK